jgi:hypothetical protein
MALAMANTGGITTQHMSSVRIADHHSADGEGPKDNVSLGSRLTVLHLNTSLKPRPMRSTAQGLLRLAQGGSPEPRGEWWQQGGGSCAEV